MQYTETWQIFEFVSAMLELLAMLTLVILCIFRAHILECIILSSAVLEEYKFINPTTNPNSAVKAFMLPAPLRNSVLAKGFMF